DAEPRLLLHEPEFAATAALARCPAVPLAPGALPAPANDTAGEPAAGYDDPVLIVYTSGTTGRAKGALLTQGAVQWNAVNATAAHDLTGADRVLTTVPLFHVGGLNM